MLLKASLRRRLYALLAEITGELPSGALIVDPILGNVQLLARHCEGINGGVTNMQLRPLRASSLISDLNMIAREPSCEKGTSAEADELRAQRSL
jgi:hypothetical protein